MWEAISRCKRFDTSAAGRGGRRAFDTLALVSPDQGSTRKKLFLVDAMAHVYRAFFAPMMRMNAPDGTPTKVPFLFANILKRLLKDYQPEYLAIVFDPPGETFRDKLFEKYKAQRQPMPDEMKQQLWAKDKELREKQREIDRLYGKLAAASPLSDAQLRDALADALGRLAQSERDAAKVE